METTVFISRIISIIYIAFGLGLVLNKSFYKKAIVSMLGNSQFLIFGGFLAIVVGMSILTFHNYWKFNLQGFITLLGVLGLFKGVLLLMLPMQFKRFEKLFESDSFLKILTIGVLVFGSILAYFSFTM